MSTEEEGEEVINKSGRRERRQRSERERERERGRGREKKKKKRGNAMFTAGRSKVN
jgi:hypothetical protein